MYIYKVTNLINGKFYIGQQSHNRKSYIGSGILIKKAINKYGKENFKKEILESCETKEELNEREIYWIENLNAIKEGYNISKGGGNAEYNKLILDENTENDIISSYKNGNTLSYISQKTNLSLTKIQSVLKEHSINLEKRKLSESIKTQWSERYTKNPTDYASQDIIIKTAELFNKGYNKIEISKKINVELKIISKILKKLKLKRFTHNRKGKFNNRGKNNPNYKILTSEIIFNIVDDYKNSNLTVFDLSKKYNIGYKKIRNVLLENKIEIKKGPKKWQIKI